ncbi:hypothetical protein [Pseudalkalibacillus berkeleyi]|nr:hypothetical protein [Pseudalkalibacillus berkeleyi]
MKEYIGKCYVCNASIFCLDGFLNGVQTDKGEILCFNCAKENEAD